MSNIILSQAQLEVLNNAAVRLQQQKEMEGQLKGMVFAAKYVSKPTGFAKGVWSTLFGKDDTMEQLMAMVAQEAKQQTYTVQNTEQPK